MKILIDAGHGIDTAGKRSPDSSFREYLFNRQVAEQVYSILSAEGYDVEMVVTEIEDIPLKERVKRVNNICNKVGAGNALLLSIHANAAGNGQWMSAQGWCCFTTKGVTKSDKAAECMYTAFEQEFKERKFRKDLSDGDKDWEQDFYIIKHASCPAVLLENFFYDNKEECQWLLREDTRIRISEAIVQGVKLYVN